MLLSVALTPRSRKICAEDEKLFCRTRDRACPKTRQWLAAGEILRGLTIRHGLARHVALDHKQSPLGHKHLPLGHKQTSMSPSNDVRHVSKPDLSSCSQKYSSGGSRFPLATGRLYEFGVPSTMNESD